jgi:hypothetical protein
VTNISPPIPPPAERRGLRVVLDRVLLPASVIGLLGGFAIAEWSAKTIEESSLLTKKTAAAVGGLHWLPNNKAVAFVGDGENPIYFTTSGEVSNGVPEPSGAEEAEQAGLAASIGDLADDGVLLAHTADLVVVTPGGLAAVDGDRMLYVTGSARVRNRDKSGERGIVAQGPDPQAVWRTATSLQASRQPIRFELTLPFGTTITAMIALPKPGHIAVGGADGRVAVVGDGPPIFSSDPTAAQKGSGSHGAAVVALAATGAWNQDESAAQIVSAASDGSIKLWYPRREGGITSQDVAFPSDASHPPLAADSLELSKDGRLLVVRSSAGDIYALRVVPDGDAVLKRLPLGFPVTASALGADVTLYAAAPDCSIREFNIRELEGLVAAGNSPIAPELLLGGHGGLVTRLAISNDQQYLAAESLDGRVRIHRLPMLRRIASIPLANLPTGPRCANRAALNLAPAQALSVAISQIQTLMESIGLSCSGGARGVPPFNWTSLQYQGSKAVSSLDEAKLDLAKNQTSDAVQQISFAQGELDALVDGLHYSCPGGARGLDPVSYSAFMSTRVTVKQSLDELKRSLGK